MTDRDCGVPIIGHRGCALEAPENTLASIELAWRQHADAVEIDVYLTRDGHIVAHHDETTLKTAGLDRRVADQSLAELRALDVGRWKSPRFAGERIPTLREVLATVPDGRRLLVEVKCGTEIVPALSREVAASGISPKQVVVISFDRDVARESRVALPDVEVAWIVEIARDDAGVWTPPLDEVERDAKSLGVHGVDLGYAPPLTKADVDRFHAAGLKVYIWTANEIVRARELRAAGVAGLTTDRPGSLREELAASP